MNTKSKLKTNKLIPNNSRNSLFAFIIKNKLSLVLIILFIALFKQNILDNNFPNVVLKKQKVIESIQTTNLHLLKNNAILSNQIISFTQEDLNLIESKARYKYGLIKEGEKFYTIVNTDNAAESIESTL